MAKRIKKMDDGGPTDPPELNGIKNFYKDYLNSPNYIKRLKAQGYNNPTTLIKARLNQLNKTQVISRQHDNSQYVDSAYDRNKDRTWKGRYQPTIYYNPDQGTFDGTDREHTLAHEFGHDVSGNDGPFGLNQKEQDLLYNKNQYNSDTLWPKSLTAKERMLRWHDKQPNELKADIDSFRYQLRKDGTYNTGTQDFNQKLLNDARKKYGNTPDFKNLFERLNDKDFIYIMNNVASNQTIDSDTAENGIKMKYQPTIEDIFSPLKAKSGIHIKPENKGKFNATKKATGKTTEELTHSSNPVTKKRAIFAQNASKWHHAEDGTDIGGPEHPLDLNTIPNPRMVPAKLPRLADTGATKAGDIADQTDIIPYNPGTDGPDTTPLQVANRKNKTLANVANGLVAGAGLFDAFLPYGPIKRQQIVRPQDAYNPHPYGTGSQALMEDGGQIYNPPFRGDIARETAEDKAGAPKHYYHSDDDYYENGGPIDPRKPLISTTSHKIDTPSFLRRGPNGEPISPSYEFMTAGASKDDSTEYKKGFYNSANRLVNKQLRPFQEPAFFYGQFNSPENEARNPKVDVPGASNMFNRGVREGYMNINPDKITKGENGGQFGGYEEAPKLFGYEKDETANRAVFEYGGELAKDDQDNRIVFDYGGKISQDDKIVFKNGGKAKYGYRVHQDPARNRPTFDDGGYIKKLNSKGKVIENIMENGGRRSSNQIRSDRPYDQMQYFEPDFVAKDGALISPEQARSDFPYTQEWYANGGILPPQYGKDEDMNKLILDQGGSVAGFTGVMAAKVGYGYRKEPSKGKKKATNGGEYADAFDDKMLLTAEYKAGGYLEPETPFVPKNRLNVAQKGQKRGRPVMDEGGEVGGPGFTASNLISSSNSGIKDAQFIDHLNYALATGKAYKGVSTSKYTPDQMSLLNGAYTWKAQSQGKTPEQTIQSYYDRPVSAGNTADTYRQKLSKYSNSPVAAYYDTPNADVQALQGQKKGAIGNIGYGDGVAKMDDGGGVSRIIPGPLKFHYGGDAEAISNNPYAGPTVQFKGPSHEDGGIGMSYGGKKVEVEGGETGVVDQDGDFNVMGNMVFPGTNTKFKALSKKIATQENSVNRKMNKATKLMDENDPNGQFQYLNFNSGRAMAIGSDMKMKRLAGAREQLSDIQNTILDTADRMKVDPQDLSKGKYTAKAGIKLTYEDGGEPDKPTRSDRNHNPGNIKFGKWAQAHGATGKDKDGFAIFGDDNVGLGAMKSLLQSKDYNKLPVKDAINKWTAGKPYQYDLGELASKPVGQLNDKEFDTVVNTMKTGEGTRYGVNPPPASSKPSIPEVTPDTPTITYNPKNPPNDRFHVPYLQNEPGQPLPDINPDTKTPYSSTKYNKLNPNQILPEIYAAATNHEIPVPTQKYQPQLLQPYQVSFQDRINENNDTFSAIAKQLDYNPSALSSLGASKYSADNAVKAEEFRTNQGISSDITNKNVGILNDAQLKNLQLADTQMVRQATARAKTKANTQEALNSVSSKILQNDLENRRMMLYEPLFDYRLDDTNGDGNPDTFDYQGGPAVFNYSGQGAQGTNNQDVRTKTIYDRQGQVKETQKTNMAPTQEEIMQQRLLINRRKLYIPPR